jgi:hypothetical protein
VKIVKLLRPADMYDTSPVDYLLWSICSKKVAIMTG